MVNYRTRLKPYSYVCIIFILFSILSIGAMISSSPGSATEKYSSCKDNATKLLKKEKSKYGFSRCEEEVFSTKDGQSLTRIRVVSGEVEKRWEFECGYLAACNVFVGWFDEDDSIVEFVDAPEVANHDPAVYTLGCGDINSSSNLDANVEPTLVFEDGQYWWEIKYNDTLTYDLDRSEELKQKPLCKINGTSRIGKEETLSSVQVEYLSLDCESRESSICKTTKALNDGSVSHCKDLGSAGRPYDYQCTRNFVARTGNMELCGTVAKYGSKVDCELIPRIKEL